MAADRSRAPARAAASPPGGLTGLDIAVAAGMNLLWGMNIVAVKMAVDAVAPLTAAALRQTIVFLVCASALRIVPGRMRALLGLGLLSGCLFYVATNLSLAVTDNVPALAIAGQLGVPFSMLLAIVVLKERIHWPRMLGIGLALAGVAMLVFDPSVADEVPGLALTALAALIWAACSLIQRQLRGVPVLTIYAWIGLCGTLGLAPLAWRFEPATVAGLGALPLATLGWIAFSAIGSTVAGQGAMSWLLQRHPVSMVTPLTLAGPVVSVLAASWWFATPITPVMAAGGAVAMVGVGIVAVRSAVKGARAT